MTQHKPPMARLSLWTLPYLFVALGIALVSCPVQTYRNFKDEWNR